MHSTYKKGDLFLLVGHPSSGFHDGSVAKMQDVEQTLLKLVSGECKYNNAKNGKPGSFAGKSSLIPITPAIADLLNAINNGDREAARAAAVALSGVAVEPAAPAFEAEVEAAPAFEIGDWVECISTKSEKYSDLCGIEVGDVRRVTGHLVDGALTTGGGAYGDESNYRLIAKHDDRTHWRNWKEGDFVRVLSGCPWWKSGGKHEIRNVNGNLGVYDLDGTFRPLPLAIEHELVRP